jgi:hypothetical protein
LFLRWFVCLLACLVCALRGLSRLAAARDPCRSVCRRPHSAWSSLLQRPEDEVRPPARPSVCTAAVRARRAFGARHSAARALNSAFEWAARLPAAPTTRRPRADHALAQQTNKRTSGSRLGRCPAGRLRPHFTGRPQRCESGSRRSSLNFVRERGPRERAGARSCSERLSIARCRQP